MASTDEVDDDYVAKLLIEDAKRTSKKYSQQGLSSFLSNGRSHHALKPNTRFLSHIVREADQHNTALKRKEEAESELRLRALDRNDHPRKRRRTDEDDQHRRSRLLKDITDAASSTKRSRHQKAASTKDSGSTDARRSHSRRGSFGSDRDTSKHREKKRKRERSEDLTEEVKRPKSTETGRREQKPISASPRRSNHHKRNTGRSPSPESSDPLEDITRELPRHSKQPQVRGRGSKKQKSNIDGHFSPNYDPAEDVSVGSDEEADNWDMALEAFRDRAKWKRNQSSRLREAGFDEDEISRWSNGALDNSKQSLEGNADSIKWSKKGETREWDAGKALT